MANRNYAIIRSTMLLFLVSAVLLSTYVMAQSFQGSSVVYMPEGSRALIFGGFSGSATLDSIASISFANSFDANSPSITRISPGLPNAAYSLAPVVRQSSGNNDFWEIALFGGAAVNTTNPSGSPVPLNIAINLSASASSNRVLGVRLMSVPTSVTGGDVVNSCTSLSATARAIVGAVEPNAGFAFGGYSRRENATLDSLFMLGSVGPFAFGPAVEVG
ncbi:hypothetical protein BCR44DRAFT_35271 [Catenaria anguillulae PL171]|uniref:DOMON domain-containing protein n=1 Tax=Catenaria anguillulae PL171 TaxID=765915 RepID=A0A1Y2HWB2_9FUNG|nr:hypothetical protein BCR44DRAFT_35271 [Catenaria anguillulae PL171]